jgi:Fe-S cluster biogenesis protein NfuA
MNETKQATLIQRVENALESVRQYLIDDGGNVEVIDISDQYIVRVRLLGACSTCPQSYMTMKAGIEETVKKEVPEIKGVVAVIS